MSPEIIVALISLSGVLVSVAITFFIEYSTNRFDYKQLYAQTVSSNRMEWINVWRENVSKFLACAEILHKHPSCIRELVEIEKELYETRAMILTRLNLTEKSHREIKQALMHFQIRCDCKTFVSQRNKVITLTQQILKPEWERVKQEAKGKMRKKR